MPAKSKSQQRFMGMVHNCQKTGDCASPAVKKAADSMSAKEANKFAKTKRKNLPEAKLTFREFIINENMNKADLDEFRSGFEDFMKSVDRILINKFGIGSMDFPDFMWMAAYEDEYTPEDAVEVFIEEQDGELDF